MALPIAPFVQPVTSSDGADPAIGATTDVRATWYDSVVGLLSLMKLAIAVYADEGSHVYTYSGSQIATDAWTLFGTTHTKTYTYNASGQLTNETAWV